MKKRLISLALTLALCMGLSVPAMAADASSLDASARKAYYDVLTAQINEFGVRNSKDSLGLAYAGLEDMNADGTPELVTIALIDKDLGNVRFGVWTIKNGSAVQTVDEYLNGAPNDSLKEMTMALQVAFARKNGQARLFYDWDNEHHSRNWNDETNISELITFKYRVFGFFDANGEADVEYFGTGESRYAYENAAYDTTWSVDSASILTYQNSEWSYSSAQAAAITDLQAALAATSQASAAPASFTDVKAGDYYEEAVKWAIAQNITSGTSATTFSPDETCTVAQILTFLWRANGSPELVSRNPFSDISSSDYYYQAAVWAYDKGLVSGNKFNPDAACTRSMTVTYLWKLAGSPTAQSGNYQPLMLTETWNGNTCVVSFDAASTQQAALRLCDDQVWENGVEHNETIVSGTLITVPSGSRVKISNPGDAFMPWGADAIEIKWYYPDNTGVFHSQPGISSETLSNGEVIKDNAVAPFVMDGNTYLLTTASGSSSFADVPATADYAQAVTWAVEKGITAGINATTFGPNITCTRGQIVTFLHRAMG